MEQAEGIIREIIEKQGVGFLMRDAHAVYRKLISNEVDASISRVILITLLAGAPRKSLDMNQSSLSEAFQKECYLQKDMADRLADMYLHLFSKSNMEHWGKKEGCGLREFCGKTWEYKWSGEAVWDTGNVHLDCWGTVTANIKVADETIVRKNVEKLLKSNPYTSAEKIFEHISKTFDTSLDSDLEWYVTGDNYYPPVMEDYHENCEDVFKRCCEDAGMKIISFEYEGDMSDFIPNHERW